MKTLLIIGAQGSGKSTAARVAQQIAEQHHGVRAYIIEGSEPFAPGIPAGTALVIRTAMSQPPRKPRSGHKPAKPDRTIDLDKFQRGAFLSRSCAFALREAVDTLLAFNHGGKAA